MEHRLYLLTALLGLITVTSGHGLMIEPYPYNYVTEPLYQNWPLSADLPFPCQGRTQHIEKPRAVLTGGTHTTVKFWIAAVHGGGSCQFSIAYGYPPPSDVNEWKTLYTIIGGCPAEAAGNLPVVETDANGRTNGPACGNSAGEECVRQFDVPIPQGIRNGNATLAWTWLNKDGNREFYMSCSPVTITGGTDDEELMSSLPPPFRANIPGQCTTGESGLLVNIPNPGKYGVVNDEPSAGANGGCATAPSPTFQSGTVTTAKPAATSTTRPMTLSTVITPVPQSTVASATASTSARKSSATSFTTSRTTSTANPAGSAVPAVGEVACTAGDGQVECFSISSFGICNEGFAVPQFLNADQTCSNGEITYKAGSST